ncbi:MAG: DUF1385 domain-containing protein [Thermodesulfovibrionales bacterium]|nr:DUF1385 domain-containing protein [Thermodesulfovibrionales bacterium]
MKNIGGQAVIEGVMMKSPLCWSVAVRDSEGKISLKTEKTKKLSSFYRLPLIRGVISLCQALSIGIKAIEFSGSVAYKENQDSEDEKHKSTVGAKIGMMISIVVAIAFAIVIFKFLPLYLTTMISQYVDSVSNNSLFFNFTDGLLRVSIFLLYVFCIGLWKEMKRVYQYHGAEHKVIYTYESGEDLTVENAKKYKPYHPRCGTSFLLLVMIISIMVFMLIPQHWDFMSKLLSRIVLIPLIAGISYEVLRFSAKKRDNPLIRLLIIPGLLLQRLTVREPEDLQIEVALAALNEVLKIEGSEEGMVNVR